MQKIRESIVTAGIEFLRKLIVNKNQTFTQVQGVPPQTSKISKQTNILYSAEQIKRQACKFIGEFEGCKLQAYKCPAGVWTIGYGHTKNVKDGLKITQEEAELFLEKDVTYFYDNVCKLLGNKCTGNQIIALTSFAFNLGIGNLKKSTLLKVIKENPSNFVEIRKEFMRWVYADKKILKGLQKRRKAEADIYEKQPNII